MRGAGKVLIATILMLLMSIGALVYLWKHYQQEVEKNQQLESQLSQMAKDKERSAVMQSVNAQMEQIAIQERHISDEQRLQAELQRQQADIARRNADEERQRAIEAGQRAVEASQAAKSQQAIAEQQRSEAEYQKRVADTLSYIALARSLASTASTQRKTGNSEIASLLAYASLLFTNRYHGDVYNQSVYQSLVDNSKSLQYWNKHKGSITDIVFIPGTERRFITCSTYGEVKEHKQSGNNVQTKAILQNSNYDFRDIYVDYKTEALYATSRTGHVIIQEANTTHTVTVPDIGDLMMSHPIGNQITVIGKTGIAIIDIQKKQITTSQKLPFTVIAAVSNHNSQTQIFDNQGNMYSYMGSKLVKKSRVPVSGQVTAYALSKDDSFSVYGMSDGTIYLVYAKGKVTKLIGHRSRVTKIKITGQRIYSSSYDGTLNLWIASNAKIEPQTIVRTEGWIINFTFDPKEQNILVGDQRGNLTEACIYVPRMVEKLRNSLKRNLTRNEWNYYVGQNVAYERFIGN